ncbi:YceI family protein [Nocardia aurantia]|uniref:Protein YceI n=1 Tax=Nocardia aurantia TaxID=2585199 RepID=A0A7K0DW33_9NOCA|nr:YceI family protein [Nocardia aurantia]MQY29522.1 Protein YceI [Nocardia aurantia]
MTGLDVQIRTPNGWPIPDAVLTVTDLEGRQLVRVVADASGAAATGPLPPGMHTAVVTAPGYQPEARIARIGADGGGVLGELRLVPEATAIALPPPGPWTIDPEHSTVVATARHMGIASIRGRFAEVGGRLDIAETFEHSTGYAEIKAASIDTGVRMRDDHLRSADFLDVEHHPLISFTGNGLRRTGSETWVMAGELDLHGRRRPIELDLTYGGCGPDLYGGTRAAFHAETLLHRENFAMDYNAMVRVGVAVVGTTVKIDLDIELVQGESLPSAG